MITHAAYDNKCFCKQHSKCMTSEELLRQAQPLIDWLREFVKDGKGKKPTVSDVPSKLSHLWPLVSKLRGVHATTQPVQATIRVPARLCSTPSKAIPLQAGSVHQGRVQSLPNGTIACSSSPTQNGGLTTPGKVQQGGGDVSVPGTPLDSSMVLPETPVATGTPSTRDVIKATPVRRLFELEAAAGTCTKYNAKAQPSKTQHASNSLQLQRTRINPVRQQQQQQQQRAAEFAAALQAEQHASCTVDRLVPAKELFDLHPRTLLSPKVTRLAAAAEQSSMASNAVSPVAVRAGFALTQSMHGAKNSLAASLMEARRCQALPSASKRPRDVAEEVLPADDTSLMEELILLVESRGPASDVATEQALAARQACAGPAHHASWSNADEPGDLWFPAPAPQGLCNPAPAEGAAAPPYPYANRPTLGSPSSQRVPQPVWMEARLGTSPAAKASRAGNGRLQQRPMAKRRLLRSLSPEPAVHAGAGKSTSLQDHGAVTSTSRPHMPALLCEPAPESPRRAKQPRCGAASTASIANAGTAALACMQSVSMGAMAGSAPPTAAASACVLSAAAGPAVVQPAHDTQCTSKRVALAMAPVPAQAACRRSKRIAAVLSAVIGDHIEPHSIEPANKAAPATKTDLPASPDAGAAAQHCPGRGTRNAHHAAPPAAPPLHKPAACSGGSTAARSDCGVGDQDVNGSADAAGSPVLGAPCSARALHVAPGSPVAAGGTAVTHKAVLASSKTGDRADRDKQAASHKPRAMAPRLRKGTGAGMLHGRPGCSASAVAGLMGLHTPAVTRHGPPLKRAPRAAKGSANQSGHNFVRVQSGSKSKHSFGYQSKSAASGRLLAARTRMRRVNGKMVKVAFRAPRGAGQGGETVEGFRNEPRCFRCGESGHWARQCPHELGTAPPPSTEGAALGRPTAALDGAVVTAADPIPAAQEALPVGLRGRDAASFSDEELRLVLQSMFGHEDFRGRQLEVLRHILAGQSVLGILPTGAGKSLCYQLAAALLPGVVLVVSPLLALMRDQLDHLPQSLPGAMISGELTGADVRATLAAAGAGRLKLLYVAPEQLLNPAIVEALQGMPQISLVCVDEAHCVAEWGHGFRPAYFRLGFALHALIRPRAVLALTATATRPTERCIAQVLGLPPSCTLRESPLRDNLSLRVWHDNGGTNTKRSEARLLALFKEGGPLHKTASVIVYVAYKDQAESLAQALTERGIRTSHYHGGVEVTKRSMTETSFRTGTLRVVVATTAFGMGVDNANVGAVVHLVMPRSMEEYVQQIGRAGRAGHAAQCFLMLDADDYIKLRSFAFSSAIEQRPVREMLGHVFAPKPALQLAVQAVKARRMGAGSGVSGGGLPEAHRSSVEGQRFAPCEVAAAVSPVEAAAPPTASKSCAVAIGPVAVDTSSGVAAGCCYGVLPLKAAGMELDMAEETIESIMSYLQGYDSGGYLRMLPRTKAHVDVRFHATAPQVLAQRHPVIAALLRSRPRVSQGSHRGVMARMVAASGMSPSQIIKQLAYLARLQEIHFIEPSVREAQALAWQVLRPPPDLDDLANELHCRLYRQSAINVRRLDVMYAHAAVAARLTGDEQEAYLSRAMSEYFAEESERQPLPSNAPTMPVTRPAAERVAREVAAFLLTNRQKVIELTVPLTGTSIARIFHGLHSPAQPRDQWVKCGWWEKYRSWDFALIAQQASEQLRKMLYHWQQQAQGH